MLSQKKEQKKSQFTPTQLQSRSPEVICYCTQEGANHAFFNQLSHRENKTKKTMFRNLVGGQITSSE